MSYLVYVLEDRYNRLYIGQTKNLEQRLEDHNSGRTKSLRGRAPFKIIHTEPFETRTEAVRREKSLKSGQGRLWLRRTAKDKI